MKKSPSKGFMARFLSSDSDGDTIDQVFDRYDEDHADDPCTPRSEFGASIPPPLVPTVALPALATHDPASVDLVSGRHVLDPLQEQTRREVEELFAESRTELSLEEEHELLKAAFAQELAMLTEPLLRPEERRVELSNIAEAHDPLAGTLDFVPARLDSPTPSLDTSPRSTDSRKTVHPSKGAKTAVETQPKPHPAVALPEHEAVKSPVKPAATQPTVGTAPSKPAAKPRVEAAPVAPSANHVSQNSWPAVDPKLGATNTPRNIAQFKNGSFHPTQAQHADHVRYTSQKSTLVSLKQEDDVTSLCLADAEGKRYVAPISVKIDSGAEVKIMVSEAVANVLNLTWELGSATLVGVGGQGGCQGRSDQAIRVYLGGFDGDKRNASPYKGCFSITVKPLIMTEQLHDCIGHECMIGQGFLHLCLGSVDCYAKHLEFSPAWLSEECRDFKVRIPCNTTLKLSYVGVLVASADDVEDDTVQSLLSHMPEAKALRRTAGSNEQPAGARPAKPDKGTTGKKQGNGNKPKVAAPIPFHPGFPQGDLPTPAESQRHREQMGQRRREGRQEAMTVLSNSAQAVGGNVPLTIAPIGLVYSTASLEQAGMIMGDADSHRQGNPASRQG